MVPVLTDRPAPVLAGAPQRRQPTVPWGTVVALSAVLALADGFWLATLRGAVGAIERTQSPFVAWLRESTLLLPLYALATIAVMALALRWFGPEVRRPKAVASTLLLLVAASGAVTLAVMVASAAYDYHLQSAQLAMMDAMHGLCTGTCLDQQRQATIAVHIRALVYVTRWVLLTNLGVAVWMTALMGGRLTVGRLTVGQLAGHLPRRATNGRPAPGSRSRDLRLVLVGALAGAAAIHATAVPGSLAARPGTGMVLLLLTIWEITVAGLLLTGTREPLVLLAAALISLGPLALWLSSPVVGLPHGAQPVGVPGLLVGLLELASLAAAAGLVRAELRPRRPRASPHGRAIAALALVAVTTIGVAASAPSWFDGFGLRTIRSVDHASH